MMADLAGSTVFTRILLEAGATDSLLRGAIVSMSDSTGNGQSPRPNVVMVDIDDDRAGQRLDNFLMSQLKGVPRTRVYRMVRSGEVRVNKGRKQAAYRLLEGDVVRIPPVRQAETSEVVLPHQQVEAFADWVLFEDSHLLAINKPAGLAVHGGSGLSHGLIELARKARPELKHLELVHRLDRDTSGVILLAKRRSALRALHESLRTRTAHKTYWALVAGAWPARKQQVKLNLSRDVLRSGERMASVHPDGKFALTRISILKKYDGASLMACEPVTGRTHQIRVHCQAAGHAILGDPKYGLDEDNRRWRERGLKRMFLHAAEIDIPWQDGRLTISAPLDPSLTQLLESLDERD